MPGTEKRFARFLPWQSGHAAARWVVTNASKADPQSWQLYS
jgi:hypothetical protein